MQKSTFHWLVSVIVVLLWVGFLVAPSQSEGVVGFDTTWGTTGAAATQFTGPTYVAVDSVGNVYVADTGNNRISKFDAAGGSAVIFPVGPLLGPTGIAVDSSDNVYVADTGTNTIKKYSSAGVPDLLFPVIAGLSGPTSVAIDSAGKIYVADTGNNRVGVWTALGVLNLNLPGFTGPKGVACDSAGNIYVSDTGANRVQIYSSTGGLLYTFGTVGSGPSQFSGPTGIAVDRAGYIGVVDTGNNRVQVFDSTAAYNSQFGSAGVGSGQFTGPTGIALSTTNFIYVVDTGNDRVERFSAVPVPIVTTGSKSGCFIATAAFGSPLHQHVTTLRNFRDRFLLTNRIGRNCVELYYRVSPPVADFIREHRSLRILVRWILTPIVYGLEYPVGFTLLAMAVFVVGFAAKRRRPGH